MNIIKGNSISEDKLEFIIKETLTDISNKVSKSLGYYGSNTIIESQFNGYTDPEITKDGYTITDKFQYNNPVSSTILDIIKKISKKLVNEVGDGSTSAINIANTLYNELVEFYKEIYNKKNVVPISKKTILEILDYYSKILEYVIMNVAKPITPEKLKDIATVSNNNDEKLGKLVSDIYNKIGKEGFITLAFSKTENDYYEIESGYEINRGIIDDIFTNDGNAKETFKGKNVSILLVDGYLTEENMEFLSEVLGHVCLNLSKDLIIVAKGYDTEIYNFLKINKNQNKNLSFSAIDISTGSELSKGIFVDFSAFIGAKILDPKELLTKKDYSFSDLGFSEEVTITHKNSYFINSSIVNEKLYNERINTLKEELNNIDENIKDKDEKIFNINKRLAKLQSKMAKLYIGGETSLEKNNKKYLLDDSVYSCKSAMEYGYIIGGNLIIPIIISKCEEQLVFAAKNHFKELYNYYKNFYKEDGEIKFESYILKLLRILEKAFKGSYLTVLNNFQKDDKQNNDILTRCVIHEEIFNLKTLRYESKDETTIINSPKTDIEIMKSAISIIGLLFNSNQFIGINERKMESFIEEINNS